MRKYTVEVIHPGTPGKTKGCKRQLGFRDGYILSEAVECVVENLQKGRRIGKIRFDNKEVIPGHKEAIIKIAELWSRVAELEKEIKPRAAERLAPRGRMITRQPV